MKHFLKVHALVLLITTLLMTGPVNFWIARPKTINLTPLIKLWLMLKFNGILIKI